LGRPLLILGVPVGELGLQPLEPFVPEVESLTLGLLPTGVESEQLARQLAQALACAALQGLPGLASELRKCGSVAIGADVSGGLANLLVWDVKAVLAAGGGQQGVGRDPGHLLPLERRQATG